MSPARSQQPNATQHISQDPTPHSRGSRSRVSGYVGALRPWSFSASLVPVVLGAVLAHKATAHFDLPLFAFTCLTALSVHAAGNVVNTYFDYMKGIDSRRSGDDRTLVDKILTPDEIVHLGVILYTLGCFGFIGTVWASSAKMEHLALVYFGGLSSSFLYTGGLGLKYVGLGDVLVVVTFGPLSVLFSFLAQTGHVDPATLLYAAPLALGTEAILHSNNTRDAESDARAGAVTLAIALGWRGARVLYLALLFLPYALPLGLAALTRSPAFLWPLLTLPHALHMERRFRDPRALSRVPRDTATLGLCFGLFYVLACLTARPDAPFPFLGAY